MEPINLSILVVNCKDYKPSHDYYLCKSGRHFSAVARTPEWPDYNEERRKEYNDSDDYALMPECPGMTDEEAADVVKEWCVQNDIPFNDDMDNIEAAYRWYYKYDDYDDLYDPSYICHLCGCGNRAVLSIDAIRLMILPVVQKYDINKATLFGSYARGDATAESDVDLLIDCDSIRNMTEYLSLQESLQSAIGKNVDIVMADALQLDNTRAAKRLIEHIEREKVIIFERIQ